MSSTPSNSFTLCKHLLKFYSPYKTFLVYQKRSADFLVPLYLGTKSLLFRHIHSSRKSLLFALQLFFYIENSFLLFHVI